MEYAKLQLRDTRSPDWRNASMRARGAAITLLAYCADQETGGRIDGCGGWTDRQWRDTCGLSLADVAAADASGLCQWHEDEDGTRWLECTLYDSSGQRALEAKRAQGHRGVEGAEFGHLGAEHGRKGGRPKNPPMSSENNPPIKPPPIQSTHTTPPTPHHPPAEPDPSWLRPETPDQTPPDASASLAARITGLCRVIRWKSKDPDRQDANLAAIETLAKSPECARWCHAEAQRRLVEDGASPWPDELAQAWAEHRRPAAAPPASPADRLRAACQDDDERAAAQWVLADRGRVADACAHLGWPPVDYDDCLRDLAANPPALVEAWRALAPAKASA